MTLLFNEIKYNLKNYNLYRRNSGIEEFEKVSKLQSGIEENKKVPVLQFLMELDSARREIKGLEWPEYSLHIKKPSTLIYEGVGIIIYNNGEYELIPINEDSNVQDPKFSAIELTSMKKGGTRKRKGGTRKRKRHKRKMSLFNKRRRSNKRR